MCNFFLVPVFEPVHFYNFHPVPEDGVDFGYVVKAHYKDGFAKQGALIAIGLMNMGIRDECDPAKAMLEENIESGELHSVMGGIIGLGFAYAGSCREDLLEILIPHVA